MLHRLINAVKEKIQGKPLSLRSPHWQTVRKNFLKINSTCAACGGNEKLEVHHIEPFHIHPEKELDPTNLITLCENITKCHLQIGHHGNWKNVNTDVVKEAADYLRKKKNTL